MERIEVLLHEWWNAVHDELSAIASTKSWSGKKDRMHFLAREVHTIDMLMKAYLHNDYTELEHRVDRAADSARGMIEFARRLNNGK